MSEGESVVSVVVWWWCLSVVVSVGGVGGD